MVRIVLVVLFLVTAMPLKAGVLAQGSGFADLEGGETFSHRLACQGDRARWDFTGRNYVEGSILYRGDAQVFWVIDPIKKSYFELPAVSPDDKDMRVGILAVMYGVARKALSKEDLAELERAVGRMPLPEALLDFRAKGDGKIGKIKAFRYEAYFNGTKRAEYWTAGAKALSLPEADYASMAEFFGKLNRLYDNFDFLFPDAVSEGKGAYEGVPLKWSFQQGARASFSVEFKSIERREFDPAHFELPAGLKKVEVFDLLMNKN